MSMRLKISIALTFLMAMAVIVNAVYNRLVPEEDTPRRQSLLSWETVSLGHPLDWPSRGPVFSLCNYPRWPPLVQGNRAASSEPSAAPLDRQNPLGK